MKMYTFDLPLSAIPQFVKIVSTVMDLKPVKDVVRCEYRFGDVFSIDRDGIMLFADTIADASIERLVGKLREYGYFGRKLEPAPSTDNSIEAEPVFTVKMDRAAFNDDSIARIEKLLQAKGDLISKALCIDKAVFGVEANSLSFPWLNDRLSVEERFYTEQFIRKLCEFCISHKRVNAKAREVSNEKFAMRTFCNRLGMIGDEFKGARKMLMQNLDGDAAWKDGRP